MYGASGFPQSANEVAVGTKLIEQVYYNSDVNIFFFLTPVSTLKKYFYCRHLVYYNLTTQEISTTLKKKEKAMAQKLIQFMMDFKRRRRRFLM